MDDAPREGNKIEGEDEDRDRRRPRDSTGSTGGGGEWVRAIRAKRGGSVALGQAVLGPHTVASSPATAAVAAASASAAAAAAAAVEALAAEDDEPEAVPCRCQRAPSRSSEGALWVLQQPALLCARSAA